MKTLDYLTSDGKKYFAELEKLVKTEVVAGIKKGQFTEENGEDVFDVALRNEYGTSDIPARPFMKQSFDKNADKIKELSYKANNDIANDKGVDLDSIGEALKNMITDEIKSGDFVPNSPATIRKKGSNDPLIDSGTMIKSVTYEVRGVS